MPPVWERYQRDVMKLDIEPGKRCILWKLSLLATGKKSFFDWTLWKERCSFYLDKKARKGSGETSVPDHPLSLSSNSNWKNHFQDEELRKIIGQDVMRTFPDISFYRDERIQAKMRDILFIFCKHKSKLSYRQGMHELLAPIIYLMEKELLSNDDPQIRNLDSMLPQPTTPVDDCIFVTSQTFDSHCFALFSLILDYTEIWYENEGWKGESSSREMTPLMLLSEMVHETYLKQLDPFLYSHLFNTLKIEPQLYIIRWSRLLFAREFGFESLLSIWSALFVTHLQLVAFISVSMLIQIRDRLLTSDVHEALSLLMRYPSNVNYHKIVDFAMYLHSNPLKDILNEMPKLPPVKKLEDNGPSSPSKLTSETRSSSILSFQESVKTGVVDLFRNTLAPNTSLMGSSELQTKLELLEGNLNQIKECQDLQDSQRLAAISLDHLKSIKLEILRRR